MKITSDMHSDPTVAGQAVPPLIARDAEGNIIDWRKQYPCSCPPQMPGTPLTDPTCEGCKGLMDLLSRVRADRRMTKTRISAGLATSKKAPARSIDDSLI